MIGGLGAGLLAGYGVALPIGPVGTYLMSLAARNGARVAAAAALGVATTDGVYALVAVAGGAGVRGLVQPVATPLSYAAAAVLTALAIRTLVRVVRERRDAPERDGVSPPDTCPWRVYLRFVGLTALNPSTVGYFVALVMGRQATAALTGAAAVLFVVGAFAASASWQLVLAGGGLVLGRVASGPRGRLAVAAVSAAIMLALAVTLVLR